MAQSVYLPELVIRGSETTSPPRHSAVVRITHWITTLSFVALLVSGIMILIAHPRLYWGETGGVGAPSLIDLPIPFKIGYSGWGRYVHFLSAWLVVLTGLVYLLEGFSTGHFKRELVPSGERLGWSFFWRSVVDHLRLKPPAEEEFHTYNLLQRLSYLSVVFVLFPLVILTGLGMSPAIASVVPALVNGMGGQQSARTLHFFVSSLLVLFFLVHILMVIVAGFPSRMRAMITGRTSHE
jgi:thiosulfate reductase cytochrome b subunit